MKNKSILLLNTANIFSNLTFIVPFLTPFFMDKNLSTTQIMSMQSFYMIFIILFEVPSGIISDTLGRKKTLIISYISISIAWISLYLSIGFRSLLIYQFFYAIGVSFASGTYHSYLYEILKRNSRENNYKQLLSKMQSYKFIAMGISALFGGVVYKLFNFNLLIIFTFISSIISSICIMFIDNIDTINQNKKISKLDLLKDGYNVLFNIKSIRIIVIESIVHAWVISTFFNFHLIMLKEYGFSVSLNGLYTTIIFIVSSIVMKNYKKIDTYFKTDKNILLISNISLSILILSLIFAKNPYILAIIWIIMFATVYIKGPAVSNILNSKIDNEYRATSLSMISLLKNIGGIVLAPIFGSIYSFSNGFTYISIFCIISLLSINYMLYIKFDNKKLNID